MERVDKMPKSDAAPVVAQADGLPHQIHAHLIVDKISFVAFICKTVNVAIQQKKKSDRIKTIVAAAGETPGD